MKVKKQQVIQLIEFLQKDYKIDFATENSRVVEKAINCSKEYAEKINSKIDEIEKIIKAEK